MPEVWTAIFVATTGEIIASSDANAGYRGNLLYLRQFLSANPAAANYWLQSTGANGADWVDRAVAVLAAINASTGNATVNGTLTGTNVNASNAVSAGGNISSSGGSVSAAGSVTAASQLVSTVATGTAPLVVNSTTKVANFNADALDGVDWKQAKTARFVGSQALTTSFVDVSGVSISADRDGQWEVIVRSEVAQANTDGSCSVKIVAGGVDQEEGFGPGGISISPASIVTTALVTVSGTTTIKVQTLKASGAGGSALTFCKMIAKWVAP